MIERYPRIYQETIPLPNNPLKNINIYIVKGTEHSLIIDTGFNEPEAAQMLFAFIEALDLHPNQLMLFLTHLHSDHTGLAATFARQGVPVYMSDIDGQRLMGACDAQSAQWDLALANAKAQGLACEKLDLSSHPGFRFRPQETFPFQAMAPGDTLKIPPYEWIVIDESGHTPGMLGLYEPTHQLLFCGDHILGDITPNITYWDEDVGDSLGTYLANLEAVRHLPIRHLFSAHRNPVEDVGARIDVLKAHHQTRLSETLAILEDLGVASVREVAMRLTWSIRANSWADFPDAQKWFAAGEAHAHLEHLYHKGLIRRHSEQGVLRYTPLDQKKL